MPVTPFEYARLARDMLLPSPSEKRRLRRLAQFGLAAFAARPEARAYAHVAWASLAALAYLFTQLPALGWLIVPTLALYGALAVIVLFDARYFLIPDRSIMFLLIVGALTLLANSAAEAPMRLAASGAAYAAMRLVEFLYERLRKRAGLGQGDAKLFAAAGLWLGFEGLASCLMLAVVSALVSAAILFRGKALETLREPIPFGPHLALGFWLTWALGPLELG